MRRISQAMLHEPLIPFAVIGSVLFVVYGFRKPNDQVETIEVRPATVRALEQVRQEIVGRPLTQQERQDLVESYIEDEVLMREAFRMELEKKDSRVRQRLLNVMRSTLDQPVAAPTRAELQAYFRENRERYVTGEEISFDQVSFSYGSENEPAVPEEFLASLRAGADHAELGDFAFFGNTMRDKTQEQLRRMLGTDFAEHVFSLRQGEWHGPIESQQGLHFVRVTRKTVPDPPHFDQLEDYLRQDWMFRERRELQSEKIAEMRSRYRLAFVEEQ